MDDITPDIDITPADSIDVQADDFQQRVARIQELIKDEDRFRQCIAEMYVFLNALDQSMRSMMSFGGGQGLLRRLLGFSRGNDSDAED